MNEEKYVQDIPCHGVSTEYVMYWLAMAAALICTVAPALPLFFQPEMLSILTPCSLRYNGRAALRRLFEAAATVPGNHFWLRSLWSGIKSFS